MIIPLTVRREHFEALFDLDEVHYFKSSRIRAAFIILFVLIAISTCLYFLMIRTGRFIGLWTCSVLVVVAMCIWSLWQFYEVWKLRKSILQYLDHFNDIRQAHLELKDEGFVVTLDNKTTVYRWSAFSGACVYEEFIQLNGGPGMYIPSASMSAEHYTYLSEIVAEKVLDQDLKTTT